jgi:hypothetical protein
MSLRKSKPARQGKFLAIQRTFPILISINFSQQQLKGLAAESTDVRRWSCSTTGLASNCSPAAGASAFLP